MRIGTLLASALVAVLPLALAVSPASAQQRARRPAATQDWTRVAVRTPEGGFRMGNPRAPVKVVEYLSLTCPHCAAFAHEGSAGLLGYVRTGRVSIEYRNYILNGVDVSAALLVRCASPVNYFAMTHVLLGSQQSWMGRTRNVTEQQRQELATLSPLQVAQRLVPLLGLDAVGQRYGITPALRQRCLNQAGLSQLEALAQAGARLGVEGTPTFFINGVKANANTWAGIEPMLRAGRAS
jgi:protein-disulfide isomerase